MKTAVCVLWHPGDPWREQVWRFTRERWRTHGFDPVTGSSPDGLYAARNQAARDAGDWDVALFADADIVLGTGQADLALREAHRTGGYVAAYTVLHYLDETQTRQLVRGRAPLWDHGRTGIWEAAFAITRGLWDELGGMDERFQGRMGQMTAFIHAAGTLATLSRVPGYAVHLWHPPVTGREYAPDLWARYTDATGHPDRMRELLAR